MRECMGGIEGGRGKGGLREGEGCTSIPPPRQSLVPWPHKKWL